MQKKSSPFGVDQDRHFMQQALRQANKASLKNEVPVGAVIVNAQGSIIAQAYNAVEARHTQHAHAESLALVKATKKLKNWRLEGCWVYVTLEPCSMCLHFILLSRCAGIVFGALSPLFGYHLDNAKSFRVYKKDAFCVMQGVCEQEAGNMLKTFFQKKRKKKSE